MSNANGVWYGLMEQRPANPPKILVIGAGARGHAYAEAIAHHSDGKVWAVAEPISYKRQFFGKKYIWGHGSPLPGQIFADWKEYLTYELDRRERAKSNDKVEAGVDGVLICVLDEQHAEIIRALAPLKLHMLCEKPLATTLKDCLSIYSALYPSPDKKHTKPDTIFSVGHVLRYSPHNMLLRKLLLEEKVVGEIISVEHTEPVGWWHFTHSYVRGNWRRESTTAPSLLTKSCHDIDLLLWLLYSPTSALSDEPPHTPSKITSSGSLNLFRKVRKPADAGAATNCLSCPIESTCIFSARSIYNDRFLKHGHYDWPVKVVNPEIEDIYVTKGPDAASAQLMQDLADDYDVKKLDEKERLKRPWFGRCVWESDNDVCDDQVVTITWDDDPNTFASDNKHFAKQAVFHMASQTEAQCNRRGRVYGTKGEIEYDSFRITVHDFASRSAQTFNPEQGNGGHNGGDEGLARHFVQAIEAVKNGGMDVDTAQKRFIGCTLDDVIRSHAVVFAAEDSRTTGRVVDWPEWWSSEQEMFALASEFK